MTEDKVKAQIVDIVKKEYQMQMVNLFEGNVSARMEDRVWVTPSQVSKEEMTEDMLIEMDLSGHILKCPAGFRPSSETGGLSVVPGCAGGSPQSQYVCDGIRSEPHADSGRLPDGSRYVLRRDSGDAVREAGDGGSL